MVGITAGFIFGELFVRLLDIRPSYNIILRHNYRLSENPILEYELIPGSPDGRSVISSTGLRDREFVIPKPDDVFRIVVIGDSVTYGLGCPRNETYPKQLEFMLQKIAPHGSLRFEVINLGVVGYNIPHIVELLRTKGLPFEPDLIIYGYVLNDPQNFSLEGTALQALKEQAKCDSARQLTKGINRLLGHSQLYILLRQAFIQPSKYLRENIDDPGFTAMHQGRHVEYLRALHTQDASWHRVRNGLTEMVRLTTQSRRIPVLITIFPIDWAGRLSDYPLRDVHELVAIEAKNAGFHVFDLTATYCAVREATDEKIYGDFLHPTKRGLRVAAAAILKFLCESNRLPDSEQLRKRLSLLEDDLLVKTVIELSRE